jgi:SAM-dependent methyltransferase
MIAEQLTTGHLTGIDPSSLMIKLAHRRNRAAARSGTVDFQIGKANHLPGGNAAYDAVCSANSVQLWESLEEGIAEIRRVLRPRGRVVIAVHEWVGDDLPVSVPARLRSHGFESVRVHRTRDTSGLTLNFLAHAASR